LILDRSNAYGLGGNEKPNRGTGRRLRVRSAWGSKKKREKTDKPSNNTMLPVKELVEKGGTERGGDRERHVPGGKTITAPDT